MAVKELWDFTSVPKPTGTLPVVLCRRPDGSFKWLTIGELLNDIVSANGSILGQSFYIEKAADSTIVLSGYSATTSLGSVISSATQNGLAILTGNQLNVALGLSTCTATSNIIIAINGQALVTTLGAVAVSASGSAAVSASGMSAAMLLGQVTAYSGASGTGMPSGFAATMTLGDAVANGIRNITTPVTGISASATLGTVTAVGTSAGVNATAYPSGTLINITRGSGITALATRNIVLTLAGLSSGTSLGTVTASAGGGSVSYAYTFDGTAGTTVSTYSSSFFTSMLVGGGTANLDGSGNLLITGPNSGSDGALVYRTNSVTPAQTAIYKARIKTNTTLVGAGEGGTALQLVHSASKQAPLGSGSDGSIGAIEWVLANDSGLGAVVAFARYYDATGSVYELESPGGWVAGSAGNVVQLTNDTYYWYYIYTTPTGWSVQLRNAADSADVIAKTAEIAWSATKPVAGGESMWLRMGDKYSYVWKFGINVDDYEEYISPVAGSLGFETSSLLPSGRATVYTNQNTTYVTPDTTQYHSGSRSMKFLGVAGNSAQLTRQVTLPATGTVSFERWFRIGNISNTQAWQIASLATDTNASSYFVTTFYFKAGIGVDGICYGLGTINSCPIANLAANTWFRAKLDLNCSNNTYTLTIFNAAGTQISQSAALTPETNFSGATGYLLIGRSTYNETYWIDDILDGV